MTIYLDNAAATRVSDTAASAAFDVMTKSYGNPSSSHRAGREAKSILDESRAMLAKALAAQSGEVFFTSGGTESDNWAILSAAELMRRKGRHIISSPAEHEAVLKTLEFLTSRGYEVSMLPLRKDGGVSVESVASALREDTTLVTLMAVNNETGAVTDIAGISRAMRKARSSALLHTDAVQAFLKIPFSAREMKADLISISGHKIHAPKGVGALYARDGLRLPPMIHGGGQEGGKRSGTEGLPQIAAFAAAVKEASRTMEQDAASMGELREYAAGRIVGENPGAIVIGGGAPHILSISLPGYMSESLMSFLDARGICVSKSSACKRGGRSHVLEAMKLDKTIIDGALRISLSRYTTRDEIDTFCNELRNARETLLTALRVER